MNEETRVCKNCSQNFTVEAEDFAYYKKINVPVPTWCPDCRLQRRLAWRNERTLHRRTCVACGSKVLSVFHEKTGIVVYCQKCWWSDNWDASAYATEIDFSRPFIEQVVDLLRRVPILNLFRFESTMVNSDYCNMVNDLKNCYLLHNATFCENVLYGGAGFSTKDSCDVMMARGCELCYEIVNCINCYQAIFSEDCEDCRNVYFSKDLKGCTDCFGCVNLRGKSYYIFNEAYSKEEYEKKLASFGFGSFKNQADHLKKARELWMKFPRKYLHGTHNAGVSGDYVNHSKNAKYCFDVANVEDSKFCAMNSDGPTTNTYDFTHYGDNISNVYEGLQVGFTSDARFVWWCVYNAFDITYSMFTVGSSHLFGCVGMRKKEYCILNKQYTKEEYEKIVPKIIAHMNEMPYVGKQGRVYTYGEFFPVELSPFAYNETTAQEYFPLSREEISKQGLSWRETEERNYTITVKSEALPDAISEVPETITGEVIACAHAGQCQENCATAFRILPAELQFYRRLNIALPRLCPNCRHFQRVSRRNPLKLWHRKCMNNGCANEFETPYPPEGPGIIYCESCYNTEVA